ncbi:MAG TPA: bile acid:sodium symporter [Longimicrobiaceae bacterium]|jgi:BASS family bile acid:Na+ symporter
MVEFLQRLVGIGIPVFVVAAMLNVGLTQTPAEILRHLRDRRFVLRMVAANFVLVPLVTLAVLRVGSFDAGFEAGLLLFGVCAGAPFLIKLTQTAEHDLALGAATMLLLMLLTVAYVPLVLPRLLPGTSIGAWQIARPLLVQMVLPLAAGMLAARLLPRIARRVQPPVGLLSSVALYAVLGGTLVGYFTDLAELVRSGAILAVLVVVAAAFGIGWLAGRGEDHHEDVGGLGTAQRNTAAGLIVATENFGDPDVLVVLTVATLVSIVLLLLVARVLSRDNAARPVEV